MYKLKKKFKYDEVIALKDTVTYFQLFKCNFLTTCNLYYTMFDSNTMRIVQ